jgi:hypothetical protein
MHWITTLPIQRQDLRQSARPHLSYNDRLATAHLSYDGDISLSNLVQCQRVLKFSQQSGDRPASVNVSKSAQYKQIVNLSISPFTNPCKVWFVEKGILVDKFLAHTIVADRGKEGSDIVNGQSPKDLDTIVIVLAHTKATIAKVIKRNSVALLLPMPERTQLFSNCLTIVMRSFGLWTSDREEYLY